jgi:hypothetical protein
MTQDVSILYQGGSAGFALYYYLLLTGQFQHSIEETWQLIDQQFPAEISCNHRDWKKYEFWPNNHDLKTTTGRKLFLVCNPLWGDFNRDIPNNTYKIFIYTKIRNIETLIFDYTNVMFIVVNGKTYGLKK